MQEGWHIESSSICHSHIDFGITTEFVDDTVLIYTEVSPRRDEENQKLVSSPSDHKAF